jgi:hypothetical protein
LRIRNTESIRSMYKMCGWHYKTMAQSEKKKHKTNHLNII